MSALIEETPNTAVKWYQKIPNAYVIIFGILILMSLLTYIIPSGEFQREMMDNGRMGVVPDSYQVIEKTPEMLVSFWGLFKAIPTGMTEAANIIVLVFLSGGLFELLQKTNVISNGIGILVRRVEQKNISKSLTITILTVIFGILGASIGFENLIPFVPLGVMIALGLGFDIMVGAGIVIGGVAIGFATSPINPYTVGVSHGIAGLPLFSGMGLRSIFCLTALLVMSHHTVRYSKKIGKDSSKSLTKGISTAGFDLNLEDLNSYHLNTNGKVIVGLFASLILLIIYGVISYKWYLTEISALFVAYTLIIGIVARMSADEIVSTFMRGAGNIVAGALIIGFARAISVIMDQGHIADTIINTFSAYLDNFSPYVSACLMTLVQGAINFFIPSGSGQAMATMPIILPMSDIIGISQQTAILAFQIGDGFINMMIPTLGGLLAMLALARVPFDKWFRFIVPLVLKMYVLGWGFLAIAITINW